MFHSPDVESNAQVLLFLPPSCLPEAIALLLDWQGISVERVLAHGDLLQKAASGRYDIIVTNRRAEEELAYGTDLPMIDVEAFVSVSRDSFRASRRFNAAAFLKQLKPQSV